MTTPAPIERAFRALRSQEGGYVAVMTGLLMIVFMGLCAFGVDVGRWYVVGQQEQRAADAAALAGVTSLPDNNTQAFANAQTYSKVNGFANGGATTVTPLIDGRPTRLRVTVTRVVDNIFGPLLGVPKTTITRTAVADYAGPVPLGSPCNEYGDDPDPAGHKSANCSGAAQFWANVGSPLAPKGNGDAYQNDMATNSDYDPNGYFYSVTVRAPVSSLKIEAFDPALINVGDVCDQNNLVTAKGLTSPTQTVFTDASTRYKEGTSPGTAYCTGDVRYGGTNEVQTQFTVRSPGPNPWDPLSFPAVTALTPGATCTGPGGSGTRTFAGYNGDLSLVLKKGTTQYNNRMDVAANFRQWVPLCTFNGPVAPGTYMIQVKTNGVGNDSASGHNRFSLRAYGTTTTDNDNISVAGYDKMAMYANTPNGTTSFYLARVPSGAKGQLFNVSLWDIGDGAVPVSTVTVLPPAENPAGSTFANCTGGGVQIGLLTGCQIKITSGSPTRAQDYNAHWQTISVPIPPTYSCNDASSTGCWVRLSFNYATGSNPMDTTSWTASIAGDPVRLVE